MTQNALDYSQNPSGVELMDIYLAGMADNQLTNHSGVSRPSYAKAGTFWIDTSLTPWVLKQFNGTNDVVIGTLDQSNLYFTAQRAVNDKNGNDITSTYLTTTGTAAKATADANGNVITSTYLTTTGTAAQATADANGDTITSTYAKLAGSNTFSGANKFTGDFEINTVDGGIELTPSSATTSGGLIDFHFAGSTEDYTSRIIEDASGQLRIVGSRLMVPNSATVGSAISTAAISKSGNGYMKLGNGIIIQWGSFSLSSYTARGTVNLPTAFSGTNYGISFGGFYGASGYGQGYIVVNSITSSSFYYKLEAESSYYISTARWIAIGY